MEVPPAASARLSCQGQEWAAGIFPLSWKDYRKQCVLVVMLGVIFPWLCKSWECDRTSQQDGSSSRALAGGSLRR